MIWALESGGADQPGVLWAGTLPGGLFKSSDRGSSWKLVRALWDVPQRSEWLGGGYDLPGIHWCQHHNGMWRSGDGGRRWEEITSAPLSHFGFAVAAHPLDADTAWFVPAEADQRRIPVGAAMAVTRTTDGGKSFTALRAGLPQQQCYDLVYRHGLAVSGEGRCLLMASTTGSLWASSNAGDSWTNVSTALPPVYAVCFGPPQ